MTRRIAVFPYALTILGTGHAFAQEAAAGPGTVGIEGEVGGRRRGTVIASMAR